MPSPVGSRPRTVGYHNTRRISVVHCDTVGTNENLQVKASTLGNACPAMHNGACDLHIIASLATQRRVCTNDALSVCCVCGGSTKSLRPLSHLAPVHEVMLEHNNNGPWDGAHCKSLHLFLYLDLLVINTHARLLDGGAAKGVNGGT